MEVWKDIKGFEGVYQVSNKGRVKRLATVTIMKNQVKEWVQPLEEYIFKPALDSKGYQQVILSIGGTKRTARVHRLVAEAFLVEPSTELKQECFAAGSTKVFVNHKDNNPLNNNIENLEWCSPAYNNEWKEIQNRAKHLKGEENPNSVLSEQNVLEIIEMLEQGGLSQTDIAEIFNVKQITISNIWTGRSWHWLTGIPRKERSTKKRQTQKLAEQTFNY